ncbi:MAG: exodeoxyribonuclease V subunit beta [Thiothrix sp.]|nr:MAG: exodeoxyribonuclease V subunit beta [Thiothrix sp.]
MQALDPFSLPLIGKNLIQASAGTGKTWTISLLYLRLILEQLLSVDKILVVTYTRAATDELRSRIRARLKEAVAAYEQPELASHEYQALLEQYPATTERLWYLQRALLSFDEAAVFTIHSFCQRVLQQHAFEVGIPFESELVASEADLQLQLSDQFWQQRLVHPNALDAVVLSSSTITPEILLKEVAEFIGRPYLKVMSAKPCSEAEFKALKQRYEALLEQARLVWTKDKADILKLLNDKERLNQNSYGPASVQKALAAWSTLLAGKIHPEQQELIAKLGTKSITAKVKAKQKPPTHRFFDLVDEILEPFAQLVEVQKLALEQLRYDLLIWLREQLPERKRLKGQLTFDDLLVNLQTALQQRPALATQVAEQYQVALIDEFQDTDPIQYDVFERIYRDTQGQVYYVGDPKQAIYSFRGADIYTYLQAAKSVQSKQRYTLARNFRSQPKLLEAFNLLYAHSPDPFRNAKRIDYETVSSGGTVSGELSCEPQRAPMRIWDIQAASEEDISLGEVQTLVAQAVANDIARLLLQAQQGQASIDGQALTSGDFAVLVRSHRQGRLIKEALQTCGIASVQKSPVGVFQTEEAEELRLVLSAIAEPSQISKLRRALVTELMGGTAASLLALDTDPSLLDAELEDFFRWQYLWQKHGFMRMFRDWLDRCEVRARLLTYVDGERRLTNLLHLGELIHIETRKQAPSLQTTLRWLQRRAAEQTSEEHQLRLESDENLVQIVTIHKSKGLQYKIVYCPFLWNDQEKEVKKDWFAWYDTLEGQSCLQASQFNLEAAKQARRAEERSENLRLLYVAITRAQYHCTLVNLSAPVTYKSFSYDTALAWLLFGHLPDSETILCTIGKAEKVAQRQQLMQQALQDLAAKSQGCIGYEPLPFEQEALRYQAPAMQSSFQCREFKQPLAEILRVGSFSSLAQGAHDEKPDYDRLSTIELYSSPQIADLSLFPTGSRAGICLHSLLQAADFQQPLAEQVDSVIIPSLRSQGFSPELQTAAINLLQAALLTPLPPLKQFSLSCLDRKQRLDELEFYFPVQQLKAEHLRLVLNFLPDDAAWQAIRAAFERLDFHDLKGYMKGYIDLVFEWEGQYYLVDYKSNWLGDELDAYSAPQLMQAMADAHYYLQYLIYCVALHRYLKQRLADYTWENKFGGVFYLFLRGMHPDKVDQGIFFHKPDLELIEALETIMGA